MDMVLRKYGIELRRVNQTYLRGKCPLPSHTSTQAQSFGVNTQKNAWACQSDSCTKARGGKRGGNVLDFVAVMENCSIREAAARLQNWFGIASVRKPDQHRSSPEPELVSEKNDDPRSQEQNRPLAFVLKDVNAAHPYVTARGISLAAATTFGVGFFAGKGMMAGRVVIPIHNASGEPVAYAGRSVDGTEPKYKLPPGFRKSLELFNLHRAIGQQCVILVEGFFDCMKVHEAGYPAVALMGSTMSHEQEAALAANFSRIIVMLDGDEPGREAAQVVAAKLVQRMFAKIINMADAVQPDELSPAELKRLVGAL